MGDCDGRMYPLSRFSFKNLSNSICSWGVRLYVLKDFAINGCFNSILWSQDRGSGNRAAFSSENTSRNSWNSSGICSLSGRIFFFAVASACNWVAVVASAFIQSSSGSLVIEAINAGSSSLFWGGLVGSPSIVVFFSKRLLNSWGDRFLSLKKNLLSSFLRQAISPVFQLMSGFCWFNQGNPRIIRSFPSPVINSWVLVLLPFISNSRSTYVLIVPRLFSVPSTLKACMAVGNWCISNFSFFT